MEYKKIAMGVQYPHVDFHVFFMFRRCSACIFAKVHAFGKACTALVLYVLHLSTSST